jgi:CBS domain-containing protein
METPAHDAAHVPAIGEIHAINRLGPLDEYPRQIVELARARLGAGDDALAVSGAIGDANDALTRRLLALAESHLGPPPRRYVWLALGSHGRREQVLSSDQDSAIAFESAGVSGPAHDPDTAVKYFATLADLIVSALARAGIPLCDGGYMATNWHRPLDEYARLFRGWVESPQPEALLKAEVFLDVRACHGELPPDTLERILLVGGTRGPFRAQMARAALTFRPPLGWFGRLRTHGSRLDVKRGGTAAIVLLARLYALIAGSMEHSTVPRLRAASSAGTLNSSNAADLIEAYTLLTDLRLRHQLEQSGEGAVTDNRVPLDRIPRERRADVQAALRLVREIQEVTALRFATHAVT